MSEPARWRHDGPDGVRDLIRGARRTQPMTAAQRARTASRVARFAAAGAVVSSLAWIQGAAFGAGLGVAALVVGHLVASGPPASSTSIASMPSPTASIRAPAGAARIAETPPAPSAAAAPTSEVSAPRPRAIAISAQSVGAQDPPVAPPPADSLAAEAALLERARAALASSPAEALALAERHAAEFPSGKLSIEREIVAVDALRRQGRAAEARARGEALRARAKGSPYEQRIREMLEGQ